MRSGALLLLAASVAFGQAAVSLKCDYASAIESQPVAGPGGLSAVLKIWSDDDHMHAHLCAGGYELLLSGRGKLTEVRNTNTGNVDWDRSFLFSEDEWGRTLKARLEGFSSDGKRVLGTLPDEVASTMLFWRDVASGKTELVDLKGLAKLGGGECGSGVVVVGTTSSGAVVLEPDTENSCRDNYRWQLDPLKYEAHPDAGGHLKILPPKTKIIQLYRGSQP